MAAKDTAPAIGIDLGTTCSVVAVLQHGKVEIIANELGFFTTPSYVGFTEFERLVGDAAKKQAPMNPTNTVYNAKRLIGRRFNDPIVQEDMKSWPFKVIDHDSVPKIKVEFKGETKEFYVEEISAMVLTKMKETAEAYLNQTVTDAVITVPAYFNNSQRQATRIAAIIAGLNPLSIINEPTAAAIAYKFQNRDNEGARQKKNILIYDLGGGTFDVSILKTEGLKTQVLSTSGDTHLGGEDFDNRLLYSLIEQFKRKHGEDILNNKSALRRLKAACEQEKRILSAASYTSVEIDALCKGINFSARLTRPRFEDLNADLFKQTLKPVEQALADASLQKDDIDEVILVGGSTRIPKIQKLLSDFFGGKKELNKTINPDEAVAYGAAVMAAFLHGDFSEKIFGFVLQDVTPLSLGTSIEGEGESDIMSVIIDRNSAIPIKKTSKYRTTKDNQSAVVIDIYQGESKWVKDNHFLGEFLLSGLPLAPAGASGVEVTFDIDSNGILTVTAVDKSNNTNNGSIKIENLSTHLSNEEIQRMVQETKNQRHEEKAMKEINKLKVAIEEECYKISEQLCVIDADSNGLISDPEKADLMRVCDESIEWLMSEPQAPKEEYTGRFEKLKNLAARIMNNFTG